jgi:hypothetical protein
MPRKAQDKIFSQSSCFEIVKYSFFKVFHLRLCALDGTRHQNILSF